METEYRDVLVQESFHPTPKQLQFIGLANSEHTGHVGYGGSIGAGKTQAGGRQIAAWAWRYPADYLVIRQTYRRLEDSTKKAMLKGDGGLPPCIPPEFFRARDLRVVDNEVRLRSGGTIKFRSAENVDDAIDAFKNMTLGGYLIDQVEELDEDAYEELFNTLEGRLRAPGAPCKGLTLSNPGPDNHWYYRRVVDPETRDEHAAYVHTTLYDNQQHLPKRYVKTMLATQKTRPDWFDRFILGKWGAFGGKRFKMFNKAIHVIDSFDVPPEWEIIEGIDYGWANPFCALEVAVDFQNLYYAVAEHYGKEMRIGEHALAIKAQREQFNLQPSSIWLDPSAWATRGEFASPAAELLEHDILVAKADNDRLGGWNRIEELLSTMVEIDSPSGTKILVPRLRIFDRCPHLVKELPNLRIKEGTDDVEKVNDHASDSLRYVVNKRPPEPIKPKEDAGDEMANRILDRVRRRQEEELYVG